MVNCGCLIISLDYELMWGNVESWRPVGYGKSNIKQVPQVIDRMLQLFLKYEIHATFSMVGMVMQRDKSQVLADLPQLIPLYQRNELSPYNNRYIENIEDVYHSMYFYPDSINKIQSVSGMEIGTHTYCHYYCWEKGQTIDQFEEDIRKAIEVAQRRGLLIKSIVFPRNQVSQEYLKVCAKYGITSYRGNAIKFFNEPKSKFDVIKNKICRIIDAYINIGGYTTIPFAEINTSENPINLRASRLLRPYNPKLACLDWLRLRRMKKEMIYAAKNNHVYHIWWHPHNFGTNLDENFAFLEELLKCYKSCHKTYGMTSYTMSELRDLLMN